MGNPADSAKSSVDRKQPAGHDQFGMPETEHPTGQAENYPPSAPSGVGGSAYPGTQGVPLHNQQNAQPYPPQQTYAPPQNPQMNNPVYQQHPQQPGYVPTQPVYPQQTSYIRMQPPTQGHPNAPNPANMPGTMAWTTGLFDCMDDPNNALITFCVPCFTFGQIAEIIDEGHSTCSTSGIMYAAIAFFTALPCLISCGYRSKLRNKYGLVEAPAADWITHVFCEMCALCQAYRELKNRGYDPAIGWHENQIRLQRQQQQVQMTPPMNQNMNG
ncbi:hypothetical protein MKW92_044401 [Papaver armeniacum]|nr:hypothetical protein MKW92_044401 [Papaver armeniacum]